MLANSRMNQAASFSGAFVTAGRRGASDAHQLYGARLPFHLTRFGVTVRAASDAPAVMPRRIFWEIGIGFVARFLRLDGGNRRRCSAGCLQRGPYGE